MTAGVDCRAMRARSLLFSTVMVAGCAHGVTLRGDAATPNLALKVAVDLDGSSGRMKVELENRSEDALDVDVDQIRLRDGKGDRYAPLGKAQKFSGGENDTRRVAWGSITLPPGQRESVELEFEKLPTGAGKPGADFSLVVPKLHSLGIEGQIALKSIRVALKPGERAASSGDAGFYDPFVE
jgi:hypothetical protein